MKNIIRNTNSKNLLRSNNEVAQIDNVLPSDDRKFCKIIINFLVYYFAK